MFKFLKDKLKKGIEKLTKDIDEQGDEEVVEAPKEEVQEVSKPSVQEAPVEKKEEQKEDKQEKKDEKAPQEETKEPSEKSEETIQTPKEVKQEPKEEKKGFFKRLFSKKEEAQEEKTKETPKEESKEKPSEEEVKKEFSKEVQEESKEDIAKPEVEAQVEIKETPQVEGKPEAKDPAEESTKAPEEKEELKEDKQEKKDKKTPQEETKEPTEKSEETIQTPKEVKQEPKETEQSKEEKPESREELKEEQEAPKEEAKEKPSEGEIKKEPAPKEDPKPVEKKTGFFEKIKEKIVTKKISEDKFNDLFWELEVALLENNVALEVIEKIKEDLRNEIVDNPIRRNQIEQTIMNTLKTSIEEILESSQYALLEKIEQKKPYVICFVGINGSGKTTTIAKMAKMLIDKDKSVVLAAADTFRAAAIDQLQIHADNLGVKMIKHDYGSDPAAVAFDAIKYAKTKQADVVLVDTAGRLHSNTNLVDEMKKIIRVANPDLKIFVGESITGNDCVEQAKTFNEAIEIDGIILSKADIDEKGGASLSISYVTKKPVLFIGTGQEYTDIKAFDKSDIVSKLGLEANT